MNRAIAMGAVATALALASSAGAQTVGATPPGVAGGVQPYRPAGAPGGDSGAAGRAGGSADSSVAGGIDATLQAGQTTGGDGTSVGPASTMAGARTPNPATGGYNGPANPSYGAPGATPYTGATGAAPVPPGAAPYTGPAGGAPGR